MKSLLITLLTLTLMSCQTYSPGPGDHYALIYSASRVNDPQSPLDKNAFFIEASHAYQEFIKRGVPAANIYFLHDAPDFTEIKIRSFREVIEKEFSGHYSNEPTTRNLRQVEALIEKQLHNKATFHLVLTGHGLNQNGFKLISDLDKSVLSSELIYELLVNNRGLKHLYLASCFSGQVQNEWGMYNSSATIITASPSDKVVWLDRNNSFTQEYFQQLPKDLDLEKYPKAFELAKEKFRKWGVENKAIIDTYYKDKDKAERTQISWSPEIKIHH